MPQKNIKRGRRAEAQKRKSEDDDSPEAKRLKLFAPLQQEDPAEPAEEDVPATEYFGMLDEAEQEYFRNADQTLDNNEFEDADARQAFLNNLHREADGKELKLACSQSCSRFLEKLLQVSTPAQLKKIFQKFNGHFLHLVQHRFASHVCETLFTMTAPVVTRELLEPSGEPAAELQEDDVFVTAENSFLYAINELEPNLGFLVTDKFASHTLRVLLIILAGLPLEPAGSQSVVRSKRKEKVDVSGQATPDILHTKRQVPDPFLDALSRIISGSVAKLDTTALRALALHPVGNPTLQLLLRIELTVFGKQKAKESDSILHKLIPDDDLSEGSETTSFLNGLVYDVVGSRLLEVIIQESPGKTFKTIYRSYFKERMAQFARNEVAGYVVCKVMERLGAEDLKAATDAIIPIVPSLAERGRFTVIKTVLERMAARKLDLTPMLEMILHCWSDADGHFSLPKLLQLSADGDDSPSAELSQAAASALQTHASVFAQAMVALPGQPAEYVFHSLCEMPAMTTISLAQSPVFSRILQDVLKAPHAGVITRRKLITKLQSHIAALALHPSGSYVVDATLTGTIGMAFLRERIAEELAEAEAQLRESRSGKNVWRNYRMDLYKRRQRDWLIQIRKEAGNDGFHSFPDGDNEIATPRPVSSNSNGSGNGNGNARLTRVDRLRSARKEKTRLELARERFARSGSTKSSSAGKKSPASTGPPKKKSSSKSTSSSGSVKS